MTRRVAVLLLVLGMLPWAGLNAQKSANIRVSARVEESCEVIAPDLALDNKFAQGRAQLGAGWRRRATCTPNTTYFVAPNTGTSPGATINLRSMVSGAQASSNRFYSDLARSVITGNATGIVAVTGVGTGQPVDHTVFGGIPAARAIPPGDYGDTISLRVYY